MAETEVLTSEIIDASMESSIRRLERPFQKHEKPLTLEMDDEYNNANVQILKPLTRVVMQVPDKESQRDTAGNYPLKELDITDNLARSYAYYSRTRGLEQDTPETNERIRILQREVLDKMTAGTGITTRVVIMNKGEDPQAFVCPDGTVFISQSLLNKLDSLDEVAGVLAHEVTHLINKTIANRYKDAGGNMFGIGWVHEVASDAKAPELLEKTGFNSLAFSTAILKISGVQRGTIHQSGLARASQSVGQHLFIDRKTSAQNEQLMPEILKRGVRKTNMEILNELRRRKTVNKEEKTQEIRIVLSKLHPYDFEEVCRTDSSWYDKTSRQLLVELLDQRIQKAGYTKEERDLFLLGITGFAVYRINGLNIFETPEDITRIAAAIGDFKEQGKLQEMYQYIFDKFLTEASSMKPIEDEFMSMIAYRSYDPAIESVENGIPVSAQSLIDTFEIMQNLAEKTGNKKINFYFAGALVSYIEKVYLTQAALAGVELDYDQIKYLFEQCKERGINLPALGLFETDTERELNGEKIILSAENKVVVRKAYNDVFEVEGSAERSKYTPDDIDIFFEQHGNALLKGRNTLKILLDDLREYLDTYELDDTKRLEYVIRIAEKINQSNFPVNYSIPQLLETKGTYLPHTWGREEPDQVQNNSFVKFQMNLVTGLLLFQKDSPEFYQYVNSIMINSGIDIKSLSETQLINLCHGIFVADTDFGQATLAFESNSADFNFYMYDGVQIENYEALLNLPFLKEFIKREGVYFDSWKALNDYAASQRVADVKTGRNDEKSAFREDLFTTISKRSIRENALRLLSGEITDQDLPEVARFITEWYPNGVQKTVFMREINKRVLSSEGLSFDQKLDFLIQNYDSVGPEGMLMLANDIQDIDTYIYFRDAVADRLEEYLNGSGLITKIATADFVSSFASAGYSVLFRTANASEKAKKQSSTLAAKIWFESLFPRYGGRGRNLIEYDKGIGKFRLDQRNREAFKSLHDIIGTLQNLSSVQRFALVHKALTDQYGAFSSKGSKGRLGKLLVDSLGLHGGFVSNMLKTACSEAAPELITFPAAAMIGPLLFRSLNDRVVDIGDVAKSIVYSGEDKPEALKHLFTNNEIRHILTSDTRSVTLFGARYQENPNSFAATLTQENDSQYHRITQALQQRIVRAEPEEEEGGAEVDTKLDAIIRGVENGGPLGIRSLQLTTQFYRFSPAVERRLSDTFDRNPGLNKLAFWENLYKLAQEDRQVWEFVQNVRIGNYLGGGSLQTTYAGMLLEEGGKTRPVIIKLKNPNVVKFIQDSYSSAQRTLEVVARKSRGKEREYAQIGLVLLDLSRKWCIDDVNDATFVEDDDIFRQTIEAYKAQAPDAKFYAPERVFTQAAQGSKLKSEDLARGQTFNQFLKDESVDIETKRKAVEELSKFFLFQMNHPVSVDNQGRASYLVHSDPHVGNYIIDSEGGKMDIGVIDRSFYLKLEQQDINVLEKLLVKGNDTEFVESFIDRVLDVNKVRGGQRGAIKRSVYLKLIPEYTRQKVRGKIDRFVLLRTMLAGLSSEKVSTNKMDIPLNLRLMVRNIGAFQELTTRYNVDLEKLYLKSKSQ